MSTFVKGGGGAGEKVKIDGVKVTNKMELTSYKGDNPLTIGVNGVAFPANTLFLEDFDILNGVNGEDLTDTVADQTTAVTELLKMVNRKIAMNNGEGEFVWKKFTSPVAITMTQQNNGANPTTFKMASSDVDLSKVDVSYFVGLKGTYAVSGSTANFEIKEDGLYMGTSLRGALTYNPSTQVLSCAGNIGSMCTWVVEERITFIDYVVSSDAEAYPNGGELNGYWYELVEEKEEGVNLVGMFNSTKFAVDKVTMASRTNIQAAKIKHSLGVAPLGFVLFASEGFKITSTNADIQTVFVDMKDECQITHYTSGSNITTYRDITSSSSVGCNPTATDLNHFCNYRYLQAGVEYTLITWR